MFKFLTTSGFKWIDSKEINLNKHTSHSPKGSLLEVHLPSSTIEKNNANDYPRDRTNKIEIKTDTPECQGTP